MDKVFQKPIRLAEDNLDEPNVELYRELFAHWNDGNWHSAIHSINVLIDTLTERMIPVPPKKPTVLDLQKFYFVNCSVEQEDWPKIAEHYNTADATFDGLTAVISEGLKVSFALNSRNDLTICSFSDRREGSPSFGGCLTGGADGWYDALRVTLYKYTALLHGDLNEGERANGRKGGII